MIRQSMVALATTLSLLVSTVWAQSVSAPKLPATAVQSLDDNPVMLPRDLPSDRTLVLVAFEREQKAILDTWIKGLNLVDGKTPWMELVVVGPQNAFVHAMIMRGMRREGDDTALRNHLLPVFSDQDAFAAAMGVSVKSAYAVMLDRAGHVLAISQGEYSQPKALALVPVSRP